MRASKLHRINNASLLGPPPEMEILSVLAKISVKIELNLFNSILFQRKTRVYFK